MCHMTLMIQHYIFKIKIIYITYIIYTMTGRPISYLTYKMFAKRYKIKLSRNGKKKTITQLAKEIYNHELTNENIINGLYFTE